MKYLLEICSSHDLNFITTFVLIHQHTPLIVNVYWLFYGIVFSCEELLNISLNNTFGKMVI